MIDERLTALDGLVADMDGVVYRGDEPIPGVADAVARWRSRGKRIVFCTNNSHYTVAEYVERLERFGIPATESDVVSSGVVLADVLRERGARGRKAMAVGAQGLRAGLEAAGVTVVDDDSVEGIDYVVVGWDGGFDYRKMRRACLAVRAGAALLATNSDATFPAPDGLWPGAGAILASIEVCSGERAEVLGKPHPPMMEAAARRLAGCRRIGIVGDRPDTDLAGGASRGWTTILVTSGVTTPEEAERVEPRPDVILPSLAAL
ncbi:MAG TPA: HAD-IIA family hydrolase [Actinomycetota bacterium]|nr:HAD-IIA family hydrolase [Actinomycetota bacterium]